MTTDHVHHRSPGADPVVELNERSRAVFRQIVDAYLDTGEPIGSRTIARRLDGNLSPATIRNVMSDLELSGLLFAPHTSSGRLPTEAGMRLFVSGLLQVGGLDSGERQEIEAQCAAAGRTVQEVLEGASTTLSGLTSQAGLVMAPKAEDALKHIEFVFSKSNGIDIEAFSSDLPQQLQLQLFHHLNYQLIKTLPAFSLCPGFFMLMLARTLSFSVSNPASQPGYVWATYHL